MFKWICYDFEISAVLDWHDLPDLIAIIMQNSKFKRPKINGKGFQYKCIPTLIF